MRTTAPPWGRSPPQWGGLFEYLVVRHAVQQPLQRRLPGGVAFWVVPLQQLRRGVSFAFRGGGDVGGTVAVARGTRRGVVDGTRGGSQQRVTTDTGIRRAAQ